jgi:type I restriction enzyme, R subunit
VREDVIERAALGWFEWLGFDVRSGAEISPGGSQPLRQSYESPVLDDRLQAALRRINDGLPEDAIEYALRVVSRPPETTLAQNNRWFHRLLTDGIDVEYRSSDGETRGGKVWLADLDLPRRNEFLAVHQFTVQAGALARRLDLVVFLNGLPIAVFELKDPSAERTDLWQAYRQLQDYKRDIPSLFVYNELMVVSDGDSTRVGSVTAKEDRFSPWRSISDSRHPGPSELEVLIKELFQPEQIAHYIRSCVTFEEDDRTGSIVKKIAAYHQFRAVQRARNSIKSALRPGGDGRGGVIWHTQGSGKSLTMLMLSAALISDTDLANPTVVVVTDRNDLDGQLFDTFAGNRELLRQPPIQAQDREDLTRQLDRAAGGVIFTTIQKFQERGHSVSPRTNIVVLADEAHRSQYGLLEGGARWMRDTLPNATFVGFTGTPLELDDRSTRAVFGEYADIYDVQQAIEDAATVPIYYEMRLVRLLVDEAGIAAAERELGEVASAEEEGLEVPSSVELPLEELVGAHERLRVVAQEIVDHFEKRSEVIEGKALVACMSRTICVNLYDEIRALRPSWHSEDDNSGMVKVVISGSRSEGEPLAAHIRSKARRENIARRFKAIEDDLKIVIVCDMWLTGFDCPPMHTMYLDKPLAGHNLMQAIARVNRVFGDKPGGVVVDFLGIADELRDAVRTYTLAGGEGEPVESIQSAAVPVMEREYETLRDFFEGFDYSAFVTGTPAAQLRSVIDGVDYVLGKDDGRQRFMGLVATLSKAFALSVPREETVAIRDHLAYFQAVRAAIRKRLDDSPRSPGLVTGAAVRQMISSAVATEGVVDLFQAAGLEDQDVGILSDEFLDRLAGLPQRNLAFETLRKLLSDQISSREHVNIIQSRTFRESLERVLRQYTNRAITTAQVVQELIALARVIRVAVDRGHESGLTEDELAFYDALADNESARDVMQDETLRDIARELADRIRRKVTLDWTQREAVRADMRRTIRRILARSGYPPDVQEAATQLVIRQAELMAGNLVLN